jgi:hypothetical protein
MTDVDRRVFLLCTLASLGLAPPVRESGGPLWAQGAASGAKRIDVHQHFAPPAWVAEVKGKPLLQAANTRWTPEQSIEEMENGGVSAAVVSITNPGLWFGDNAAAARVARACNDYGAKLVQDHPTRFGLFAAMPLPDPASAPIRRARFLSTHGPAIPTRRLATIARSRAVGLDSFSSIRTASSCANSGRTSTASTRRSACASTRRTTSGRSMRRRTNRPTDVAWDRAGNIYIADGIGNTNRVAKFDRDGDFIRHWGSTGSGAGQFNGVKAIAIDAQDNVYVADAGNKRIQVFDADGNFKSEFGNIGRGDPARHGFRAHRPD